MQSKRALSKQLKVFFSSDREKNEVHLNNRHIIYGPRLDVWSIIIYTLSSIKGGIRNSLSFKSWSR